MTRDEILRLEGRELDIALGKALGWRWYSRPYIADPERRYWIYTKRPLSADVPEDDPSIPSFEHPTGKCGPLALSELPKCSTTWQGIGLIQEAMAKLGWDFYLTRTRHGKPRSQFAQPSEFPISFEAQAETAPRAVALAAMLAMEGT